MSMTKTAAQQITDAAGMSALDVAKTAGMLQACAEAKLDWKEASEFLQTPETVLRAAAALAFER